MHEMSIAHSLIDLIREETKNHEGRRLLRVKVRHGVLAGIVPEALEMAFLVLTEKTDLEGVVLETEEDPLRMQCGACGHEFIAPGTRASALISACPECQEEFGHKVLSGREMFLDQMELE